MYVGAIGASVWDERRKTESSDGMVYRRIEEQATKR